MSKKRQNKKESKINWGAIIISIISISVSIPISICSIKIAYRPLEVANKSYEQQVFESELINRPYVYVDSINAKVNTLSNIVTVEGEVKNIGLLPAFKANIFHYPDDIIDYDTSLVDKNFDSKHALIFPGQTVHFTFSIPYIGFFKTQVTIIISYEDYGGKVFSFEALYKLKNKQENPWEFVKSKADWKISI